MSSKLNIQDILLVLAPVQVELRYKISCFIKLIGEEICSAKLLPTPHAVCYDKISLAESGFVAWEVHPCLTRLIFQLPHMFTTDGFPGQISRIFL